MRFERFEVTAPPSTPDTTATGAPSNVVASAGDGSVSLTWNANTETDLAGYNVFRGTSVPVSTTGVPINGATPLTTTSYNDTGLINGTTYHYVVEAVDLSGNRSAGTTASATPAAGSGATSIKVNFQSPTAAVPAGYLRDFGQAYGPRTLADQGTGRTYGWVTPGTTTPLDLSVGGTIPGNGRDRATSQPDQRLDTLMHMQGNNVPSFNGTPLPGSWEIAVANGTYTVTVGVGDAQVNTDPEVHTVNVEGLNVISGFVPSGAAGSATRHSIASKTVIVADGRLTVDATGGTNTKIDYIDIASGECVSSGTQPSVRSSNPANAATNVALDAPVTAEVILPNCGGIDRNTLDLVDGPAVPRQRQQPGLGDRQHQRRRRRHRPAADRPARGEHRLPLRGHERPAGPERRGRSSPTPPRSRRAPAAAGRAAARSPARSRRSSPPPRPGGRHGTPAWSSVPTASSTPAPSPARSSASRSTPTARSAPEQIITTIQTANGGAGCSSASPSTRHRPRTTSSCGSPTTSSRSTTPPTGPARSPA